MARVAVSLSERSYEILVEKGSLKGIGSWEADVMVEGDLKQMAVLLSELSESKPALYWQTFSLRPSVPDAGNVLIANGTLKLFSLDEGDPGELAEVIKQ